MTASLHWAGFIQLTWIDHTSTENGFEIERKVGDGVWSLIKRTGPNATIHEDFTAPGEAITFGETYSYRVCAESWAQGRSEWSYATPLYVPPPPPPPEPPSRVTTEWIESTYVRLTWQDNATSEDGFQIERAGSAGGWIPIKKTGPNVTMFQDMYSGQPYLYRICAETRVGGDSQWAYSGPAVDARTIESPAALRSASSNITTQRPTIYNEALSDVFFVPVVSTMVASEPVSEAPLLDFDNQHQLGASFDEQDSSASLDRIEKEPAEIPEFPWTNPRNTYDVNDDSLVTPLDVLLIVNFISDHGEGAALPSTQAASARFLDVTGDHLCTPRDALLVINYIDRTNSGLPEGEAEDLRAWAGASVTLGDFVSPCPVAKPAKFESSGVSSSPESSGPACRHWNLPKADETGTEAISFSVKSQEPATVDCKVDLLEWDHALLAVLKDATCCDDTLV